MTRLDLERPQFNVRLIPFNSLCARERSIQVFSAIVFFISFPQNILFLSYNNSYTTIFLYISTISMLTFDPLLAFFSRFLLTKCIACNLSFLRKHLGGNPVSEEFSLNSVSGGAWRRLSLVLLISVTIFIVAWMRVVVVVTGDVWRTRVVESARHVVEDGGGGDEQHGVLKFGPEPHSETDMNTWSENIRQQ
jgi:hypothetical protein